MTRRRPFSLPPGFVGQRLVGTPEELAAELGVEAGEVAGAVAAARLEAWGCNARGERVWRAHEVRVLFGVHPPPRHRGAPQFRVSIPGARARRRSAAGLEGGREWPASIEEV